MRLNEQTRFPHPVLSEYSNDYIDGYFSVDFTVVENKNSGKIRLEYVVNLKEPAIEQVLNDKLASPCVYIICSRTYYNKWHKLELKGGVIEFCKGELFGRVILRSLISAVEQIEGFTSLSLHEEYGDTEWSFSAADLLARSEDVIIDIGQDKLAPMETIFEMRVDDNVPDGETRLAIDMANINIFANQNTCNEVNALRGSQAGKNALLNSVYLPVVMEVLATLREDSGTYEKFQWFKVFAAKCTHENIDINNSELLIDAQKLLKSPLQRLLKSKEYASS